MLHAAWCLCVRQNAQTSRLRTCIRHETFNGSFRTKDDTLSILIRTNIVAHSNERIFTPDQTQMASEPVAVREKKNDHGFYAIAQSWQEQNAKGESKCANYNVPHV